MRVIATRSMDWWAVEAEHDGQPIYTQAKRLEQVEGLVCDSFPTLDVDLADESIVVVPVIGSADVAETAAKSEHARPAEGASRRNRSRGAIAEVRSTN